ncbi:methyltransferase [Halobacillus litoralis]|uniref:Methyltransferase n=1 Tax=Halobacillus litoralis TaxID=45668 RepID=A0A845DWL3_9BACI|nr:MULTISPECIES: class I SAM-dependent methyltransferase [Halobacillus]MYL21920.1 methyltransferase [Halobacillus litoralis]MYL31886.1 methyltransferase [Halobacillus halophilus]MYL39720.1 methyltransferase [Halobacillus litoralis]
MSEHYYSKKTLAASEEKTWSFELKGFPFSFTTDHAVFSKNEVDFGSRVLIDAFQLPEVEGEILDLGCGYGPIGLSLAKAFSDRCFVMVDVNERALHLAEKNAAANEVDNVTILESDRLQGVQDRKFAAVLTNPPIRAGKPVVHAMFEEASKALVPGGEIWVVIQKKQGAPSAKQKLEELFGESEVVLKQKGYYILRAKKID